jgi:glutathione S-transferase
MNELLGLPYSPWSEKARWALDVRRVPYRYRHYQPLIGEPALRMKTGRWRGNVTVPVLVDDAGRVYDDSAKIARFADSMGQGPTLFPREHEAAIDHWIDLGERALDAGRVLSLHRTLEDPEALRELVPRGLRNTLGGLAVSLGRMGVQRTLRKYGAKQRTIAEHEKTARAALDELRAALAKSSSSPKTVLSTFTFADIAAAQMLSFVSPPKFGLKLGRASRKGFTDPALAEQYADLVAWRDALYEAHRPKAAER